MIESEFREMADELFDRLQDALDSIDDEIDYEEQDGVLTIDCGGSKVIVSRQPATREIWVAARSGGFHCAFSDQGWVCSRTGETLAGLLGRVCSEQTGSEVVFSI